MVKNINWNIDEKLLTPHIFTLRQLSIIKKKLENKELTNTEKVYFSRTIRKKITAIKELSNLKRDHYIYGEEYMLKERVKHAIKILKQQSRKHRNKKILITGSFLFQENYNDIDVFIITRNNMDDKKENNVHINYLLEDIEDTLFFSSLSKLSISNFFIFKKIIKEEIDISNLIKTYEEIILFILNNNDYKTELRDFILKCSYLNNNEVLNSYQLYNITKKIIENKLRIQIINKLLVETIIRNYNIAEYKAKLKEYIQSNEEAKKETKIYDNLNIYNKTYEEVLAIAG